MFKFLEGKCGLIKMVDWIDIGCLCYDFINDLLFDFKKKKNFYLFRCGRL